MAFIKDFKEFALKGNILDLATGVVIGAAFGKIVTAVVDDLIMPVIGRMSGGIKFQDHFLVLSEGEKPMSAHTLEAARAAGANVFAYGHFIQMVVDFLIVAVAIFSLLRFVLRRRNRLVTVTAPAPTTSEVLLTDIRDLLRRQNIS